jgi:hypothetical protein
MNLNFGLAGIELRGNFHNFQIKAPVPHFSRSREKCAQSTDPAAAGSGMAAKAFGPASRFPGGSRRVTFSKL